MLRDVSGAWWSVLLRAETGDLTGDLRFNP
jgi:hypothetical protein